MESLVQKVDNITEELKTKDILLERTKVQAENAEKLAERLSQDSRKPPPILSLPPLPFNSPTTYEDEDEYMGDNEADKLRKGRRYKKGLRKGKVQQDEGMRDSDTVQECSIPYHPASHLASQQFRQRTEGKDSDTEGEDSDTESESYKRAMQKRKGKARQVEDEGMENSDTESRKVGQVEDEGMENSDTESGKFERVENVGRNDSENESDDVVSRHVNFDEDDEVIEARVVRLLY
jgi:hypothetical protein